MTDTEHKELEFRLRKSNELRLKIEKYMDHIKRLDDTINYFSNANATFCYKSVSEALDALWGVEYGINLNNTLRVDTLKYLRRGIFHQVEELQKEWSNL